MRVPDETGVRQARSLHVRGGASEGIWHAGVARRDLRRRAVALRYGSRDKEVADTLGQAVAAFAAGLGTKAVYAALEALVGEISSRIKGTGAKQGGGV